MTSPVSAVEAIEKAMEGVTPGPWHVAESGLGNKVKAPTVYHAGDDLNYVASFADFMTFHGPTRNRENARYIAACNPVAMREVLALARQAEALQRENAEKDAEIVRLRKVIAGCQWYWPGDDTGSDYCESSAYDVVESHECHRGDVVEVKRGGVVEVTYCASLPPSDNSDSDDDFWVDEPTEEAARTKIATELSRRALLGGSENAGN